MRWVADTDDSDAGIRLGAGGASAVACAAGAEGSSLRAALCDSSVTADWSHLPYELLGRAANRIVNEVRGINRVVYDVTSKPPGTIEWE